MGPLRPCSRLLAPALLLALLAPAPGQAGPLVRRAQERRACQEFAGRLQQNAGNPAMAQQVYQQGVLQLVSQFGENPCTDIPAPTAAAPAPATPATPPAAAPTAAAAGGAAAAPSPAQQQACQQFAAKLQAAAASGGRAAAQQTYTMGQQKLSGLYGPNPCPAVTAPQ